MRLIIIRVDCEATLACRFTNDGGQWRWIYLGEDPREARHWESQFGNQVKRELMGSHLQGTADKLQNDFLSWIDSLGLRIENSVAWLLTQISEKNTNISMFFSKICLLRTTIELLEQKPGNWLLVVSSEAMLQTILRAGQSRGWEVTQLRSPLRSRLRRNIFQFLAFLRVRVEVVCKYHRWRSIMRRLRQNCSTGERVDVLLHTWLRNDCLDAKERFVEQYLGALPRRLADCGYHIAYLVLPGSFVAPMSSWLALIRALAKSGQLFPAHRFTSWFDVLLSQFLVPLTCRVPKGKQVFAGEDVTPLIKAEWAQQERSSRVANAYLCYRLLRRASRKGCLPGCILYTYENHSWEKGLCLGVRAGKSGTRVVGYQHSYVPWGFLSYMPGANELRSHCTPDRIVTTGEFWKEWFLKQGHSDVRVGGALRVESNLQNLDVILPAGRPLLLVCPTSSRLPTLELVSSVYQAFRDDPDFDVWIKPHPIAKLTEEDCRELFDGHWPAHFRLTVEPVNCLLRRTSVLIYTSTSVVYEALARGVPVVAWQTEFEIDRDPLRWQPHIRRLARTTAELRSQVLSILGMQPAEKAAWQRQAGEIADQCLSPVSADSVEAFLWPRIAAGPDSRG
jgi:hypothetical protein